MKRPNCPAIKADCIESREHHSGGRHRRYACPTCKGRFSTMEQAAEFFSSGTKQGQFRFLHTAESLAQAVINERTRCAEAAAKAILGTPVDQVGGIE